MAATTTVTNGISDNNNNNNNTASSSILDEISSKAPPGTTLPPRNIREIIEKTAGYVARNGATFVETIKQKQGSNPKMSFIFADDAYHPYYQWRLDEIKEGRGTVISAGRENEAGVTGASMKGREERKGPEQPEEFKFSARMPNISAQDLEVVKLTAMFVAKNGRSWMTALSQREAGNYQFDFLRPQHTLYQFFSRLVDQYTDLLTGDSVDGGRPQKKRITELEANVSNRFRVLDRAKKRAEWLKFQEAQKVAKEEQEEKEKMEYAQIDWHDFVVVETVTFDERDENTELPAPTSLNDLQSASLEQKAAMRVGVDRRIEEAMPTFNDYDQFYGDEAVTAPGSTAPAVQPHPQQLPSYIPTPPTQSQPFHPPPQQDEGPPNRLTALHAERDRTHVAQQIKPQQQQQQQQPQPMKIRNDYTPRALARNKTNANTSLCPNCGQAIPNAEIDAHMRIEMLDPRWREQRQINLQRSSTTNLSTQDVASNLKRLASQRSDVFDGPGGGHGGVEEVGEEERARRRRKELGAYDGVGVMPSPAALAGMGLGLGLPQQLQQQQQQLGGGEVGGEGDGKGGTTSDVQEQIRQLHQKYRS